MYFNPKKLFVFVIITPRVQFLVDKSTQKMTAFVSKSIKKASQSSELIRGVNIFLFKCGLSLTPRVHFLNWLPTEPSLGWRENHVILSRPKEEVARGAIETALLGRWRWRQSRCGVRSWRAAKRGQWLHKLLDTNVNVFHTTMAISMRRFSAVTNPSRSSKDLWKRHSSSDRVAVSLRRKKQSNGQEKTDLGFFNSRNCQIFLSFWRQFWLFPSLCVWQM